MARKERSLLASTGIIAALVLLYRFPPERYSFYPACPFHAATGLLCPGCGATRALAALLHGHLLQAWTLNPLAMILLPLLALYCLRFALTGRLLRLPNPLLVGALAACAIFTVARNL